MNDEIQVLREEITKLRERIAVLESKPLPPSFPVPVPGYFYNAPPPAHWVNPTYFPPNTIIC